MFCDLESLFISQLLEVKIGSMIKKLTSNQEVLSKEIDTAVCRVLTANLRHQRKMQNA